MIQLDKKQALRLLQMEYCLLHNMAVDEKIIRSGNRQTPATAINVRAGCACINRLFKSFLLKMFKGHVVSKSKFRQEFEITLQADLQQKLLAIKDAHGILIPKDCEVGLLRFNFPNHLRIVVGHYKRDRWGDSTDWKLDQIGVGRYCDAAKAIISWKARLDGILLGSVPEFIPNKMANIAQEQFDAALKAAAEAGKL